MLILTAVLMNLAPIRAQPVDELKINGLRMGQTIHELRAEDNPQFVESSPILPRGSALFWDDRSAHFLDGFVRILAGTQLEFGSKTLLKRGQSRAEMLALSQQFGWALVGEWTSHSDVVGFASLVSRFQISSDVTLLVVFLETGSSDVPYCVSEIYLRTNDVRGPFGDENHP